MKPLVCNLLLFGTFALSSCLKHDANRQFIDVPNGDFELWDDQPKLFTWETNSCPLCVPAFETYIVKKETEAASGKFAAKFTYNGVYRSLARNKFAIPMHPGDLRVFIRSNISTGDTATITIDIFSGNSIVDNGSYSETLSTSHYKQIVIPISQSRTAADSALVTIIGGNKGNTFLYVDNLILTKDE